MNVMIIATRTCTHCRGLTRELRDLEVPHQVLFAEEHPEIVAKYGLRHSPCLVVGEQVAFRDQPTEGELRAYFERWPP